MDSAGNAYVTGNTASSDFPTASAYQASLSSGSDAFVTKLNTSGSALVYSTYLGGGNGDIARAIAVDSTGNAYVTGNTISTNFPTANPFQASFGGVHDAFVAKISREAVIPSQERQALIDLYNGTKRSKLAGKHRVARSRRNRMQLVWSNLQLD